MKIVTVADNSLNDISLKLLIRNFENAHLILIFLWEIKKIYQNDFKC